MLVGTLLVLNSLWFGGCAAKQPALNTTGFSSGDFQWQQAQQHFRDFLVAEVAAVIPTSNFDAIARLKVKLIVNRDAVLKLDPTQTQRTFYVGPRNGKWIFEREQIQPPITLDGHTLTKGDLVMLYFQKDSP
ncbi:MAG: cytochrome P450, partial [Candidatus Marinimicrobia bacterium]|nr:cytochrome P450 [Candidatus Neomarinimicrobiota bacterium]